ncbi:heavy metal translocating P-type ATPase [Natrinema zhouii]|uniref:Heavy metal translocating P-type ATPase n=1 Tax=Natrinema zhouii TaxID=1710539 RepID=A0A7D6H3D9_9EURY|nr:heavy metal translocating P-type ATPase [Natrinema zhouii]QLK24468.1 heavy metal translocating P-type ATPase [Natrinema zhouii]
MDDHDRRTGDDPEPADTARGDGERSDQVERSMLEDEADDAERGRDEIRDRQEHDRHEAGDDRGGGGHDHGDHGGHGDGGMHAGHETMFRRRFFVSTLLSIPVLLYSETLQGWLGFSMPAFPGSEWLTPVFAVIVFAYGGVPFLRMAAPELRERAPGMMTLISMAITVAFVYSLASVVVPTESAFFWELVTLIDIMLLGHWIEMRSVRRASSALDELAKLMPDTAERITESGDTEEIPASELEEGDLVLVRPGASVPADGVVEEGESEVNESMITGESTPVSKEPTDEVIGGTVNGDGSLRVRISATGEETTLAGIMRLVEEAQSSESKTQALADRAAGWLFYVALGAAAVTAAAWTIATGFDSAVIERVVTVLVIACPHALGLAIPLVVAINTSLAARNGMLVRDRIAMERARTLDTVVFDKTGTLTEGEQGVVDIATVDGVSEDEALALAATVEGDSEHMIARAIREAADERGLERGTATDFEALKGKGVRATVDGAALRAAGLSRGDEPRDGERVHVGGPNLLSELEGGMPTDLERFADRAGENAQTVVYLIREGDPVAAFALADVVREESYRVVDALHELGLEVAMLTGDSEDVARAVADDLGIDTVFAEVLPEDKDEKITELQAQGKSVAMVGDGVNDAPALTRADIGIAIGSGTDVAVQSADIILVKNNPMDVVRLVKLSRASYRKMQQNLVWAAGYNVFALPLAAGILAPIGILLSPAVGALLMSLSTVIVAINAQFLRRVDLSVPSLPGVSAPREPRPAD